LHGLAGLRPTFDGILFFALACGAICESQVPSVPSAPQNLPAPAAAPAIDSNSGDAHSISLDIVVTDKSGTPVKDLKAEDFTLLDNKQRKTVSVREGGGTSQAGDNGVEAYVLIDAINPQVPTIANVRHDLTAYLEHAGNLPIPTSLVFLTPDGLKIQGQSTREPKILLANLEDNPTSVRTFQNTSYYSAEALREKSLMAMNVLAVKLARKPGRKLVIWVSPGWAEFMFQSSRMSRKDQEDLFSYEASLSVALRAARITLYSVDPMGAQCVTCSQNGHYKSYVKGPYAPKDADHNDLLLQALAARSGGKVVTGNNNIAAMIDDCLADAQHYYVLTFEASPSARETTFHEIKVEVDKPGAQVRTRTGYYTLAQAEATKPKP
jgi:VWFA-related protein